MSYLEQQKLVEAENEERERRKIADELELEYEETQKKSDVHEFVHFHDGKNAKNLSNFEDSHNRLSHVKTHCEHEQHENVRNFIYLNYYRAH